MIDRDVLQTAVGTLIESVLVYLPVLIATILFVILGWILAVALRAATRRLLRRIRLEDALKRSGLTQRLREANVSTSPSELIAASAYWVVLLLFGVLAIQRLGIDLSVIPVNRALAYVPRVVGGLLLLVVGALLSQILGKAAAAGAAGLGVQSHRAIGATVRTLLWVVTLVLTVEQLGFDIGLLSSTLSNIITIVIAGFALTFALGGREVARNALAGFYAREYLREGDRVVVDGIEGTIEGIRTLNAKIDTAEGTTFVPNHRLVETSVERTRTSPSDR